MSTTEAGRPTPTGTAPQSVSLQQVIESARRLDELSCARLVGNLAEAAHAATKGGKPLALTPAAVVVHADGEVALSGAASGSPRYTAPEKLRGGAGDRRADVFALGVILWEALAHEALFPGADDAAVTRAVLDGAVRPPSELNANVPGELDAICKRALARDPAERYQSAKVMAAEIEAVLGDAGYPESNDQIARFLATLAAPAAPAGAVPGPASPPRKGPAAAAAPPPTVGQPRTKTQTRPGSQPAAATKRAGTVPPGGKTAPLPSLAPSRTGDTLPPPLVTTPPRRAETSAPTASTPSAPVAKAPSAGSGPTVADRAASSPADAPPASPAPVTSSAPLASRPDDVAPPSTVIGRPPATPASTRTSDTSPPPYRPSETAPPSIVIGPPPATPSSTRTSDTSPPPNRSGDAAPPPLVIGPPPATPSSPRTPDTSPPPYRPSETAPPSTAAGSTPAAPASPRASDTSPASRPGETAPPSTVIGHAPAAPSASRPSSTSPPPNRPGQTVPPPSAVDDAWSSPSTRPSDASPPAAMTTPAATGSLHDTIVDPPQRSAMLPSTTQIVGSFSSYAEPGEKPMDRAALATTAFLGSNASSSLLEPASAAGNPVVASAAVVAPGAPSGFATLVPGGPTVATSTPSTPSTLPAFGIPGAPTPAGALPAVGAAPARPAGQPASFGPPEMPPPLTAPLAVPDATAGPARPAPQRPGTHPQPPRPSIASADTVATPALPPQPGVAPSSQLGMPPGITVPPTSAPAPLQSADPGADEAFGDEHHADPAAVVALHQGDRSTGGRDVLAGWGWTTGTLQAVSDDDDFAEIARAGRRRLLIAIGGALGVLVIIAIVAIAFSGPKASEKDAQLAPRRSTAGPLSPTTGSDPGAAAGSTTAASSTTAAGSGDSAASPATAGAASPTTAAAGSTGATDPATGAAGGSAAATTASAGGGDPAAGTVGGAPGTAGTAAPGAGGGAPTATADTVGSTSSTANGAASPGATGTAPNAPGTTSTAPGGTASNGAAASGAAGAVAVGAGAASAAAGGAAGATPPTGGTAPGSSRPASATAGAKKPEAKKPEPKKLEAKKPAEPRPTERPPRRPPPERVARAPGKAQPIDPYAPSAGPPLGPPGPPSGGADKPDPAAAYKTGIQQYARGDASGALATFRASAAATPGFAPTWRGLGLVYEKLGNKGMARLAFKRYLQLAPGAGDAEQIRDRMERLGS